MSTRTASEPPLHNENARPATERPDGREIPKDGPTMSSSDTTAPPSSDDSRARALTKILDSADQSPDALGGYLVELAAEGCAVLFVMPATKVPAEVRTPAVRRRADRAAQDAARAAGRAGWRKVRGVAGVELATDSADTLAGYLDRYREVYGRDAVNLAVSVGRSRLVVVDCDTPAQRAEFLRDMGADADTPPTVTTPGAHSATGELVHHGGGHYWFTVPEGVDLPTHRHSMTVGNSAYSIKWGTNTYVLIPPSQRAEGDYLLTGTVEPLPEGLFDQIAAHSAVHPRAPRPAGAGDDASSIAEWGHSTPWSQILAEVPGWMATGQVDTCGCDVWTAPGEHASTKSATAHEPGCAKFDDSPDPPLYIWTDHDVEPFDDAVAEHGRALTRLRAVAALHHEGDEGEAMSALDLICDPMTLGVSAADREDPTVRTETPDAEFEREVAKRQMSLRADREARRRIAVAEVSEIELPPVTSLDDLLVEDDDPVRYRIEGLWPSGGAKILNAASAKTGKTTLSMNLTRSLADGDPFLDAFEVHETAHRIVIIDNEMSRSMLRRWLRRQNVQNTTAIADVVALRGQARLFDMGNDRLREMWSRRLRDLGCDFVIFDCLKPVLEAMGLDENREIGKFLYPFGEMLADAGVEDVLVHHHMGHNNERARGDSSALGWTDGNWKLVRDTDDPRQARYFSAPDVRDVEETVGEGLLTYDPPTGRLTYAGGNRAQTKADSVVEDRAADVLEALAEAVADPENRDDTLNKSELMRAVGGKKEITAKALDLLVNERRQVLLTHAGRAQLYRLAPDANDPMHMGDMGSEAALRTR